jgi:hypothetical protein
LKTGLQIKINIDNQKKQMEKEKEEAKIFENAKTIHRDKFGKVIDESETLVGKQERLKKLNEAMIDQWGKGVA